MIIEQINAQIQKFADKNKTKMSKAIELEILKFVEVKKNNVVLSIDNLSFDFVQFNNNLSFELLLQIKSFLSFLKEKIISTLNDNKILKIQNIYIALENANKENIKLATIINPKNKKNVVNLFTFNNEYFENNSFLKFLIQNIENCFREEKIVNFFNLFLIQKNYLINAIDAIEEFNNYAA